MCELLYKCKTNGMVFKLSSIQSISPIEESYEKTKKINTFKVYFDGERIMEMDESVSNRGELIELWRKSLLK